MHLWILRHAEALRNPNLEDADRPLSDAGARQATSVALALKQFGDLQEIWTSPLLRAQQTAAPISELFPHLSVRTTEELAPGTQPRTIVELVRSFRSQSLLLVGHEPLTGELSSYLTSGDSSFHVEFSPCTLALISFGREVRKGGGILKALLPPETIERRVIPHRS